jgi:hypothetical protein
MKYQFCIRFDNIDANSAASKAVLDCNKIFHKQGYKDYTFTVGDNSNKLHYYFLLLKELAFFIVSIKRNSIVGIQYPLLSINNVFKYFIKAARLKGVKFFCVVHDLESLRTGGKVVDDISTEIRNLGFYDAVIVHNEYMMAWLKEAGLDKKMIPLQLFDYLADDFELKNSVNANGSIVYAGNLTKSKFIYSLPQIAKKRFNLYGPNFLSKDLPENTNINWIGEYNPQQIPKELAGSFGLIWDGNRIDAVDEMLGNYLHYNNPHKCSLYIAAGLPVIAPVNSAIGAFIKQFNIGLLVNSLYDLEAINVTDADYMEMRKNVAAIRDKVITGEYFFNAINSAELACK